MSDLISRSGLLKAFNNKNVQITFDLPVEEVLGEDVDLDDFAMLVQDAIQAYKKMVIDAIKNQPTAYDIDKVVEELEENASRYTKKYVTPYGNNGYKDTKAISIHKAIEIVHEVAEEYKGGWIPCSERLPEESGYYLVTYHNWSDGNFLPKYDDTYVRRLHYQISEHFVGWNYPKNVDDREENDCHKEVIAWQQLPEPFKERN